MKKISLFVLVLASISCNLYSQNLLNKDNINIKVNDAGIVTSFTYEGERGETDVDFRKDELMKGPALFFNEKRLIVNKKAINNEELSFKGETDTLKYTLKYRIKNGAFVVKATVKNKLDIAIKNPILTLKPGVNTELDSFPKWNHIFFPTLLRCEASHFWGYVMNGVGDVLAMGTNEPVASWQMEYYDPTHWRGKGGHLIYSYRLDLMHKLPLPVRHPQNLTVLKPNESKTWTFFLKPVANVQDVKPVLASTIAAPMIDAESYTVMSNQAVKLKVFTSGKATATITTPSGKVKKISLGKKVNNTYKLKYELNDGIGVYKLRVKDANNKVAEASLTARQNYSWYLDKARDASVVYEQYAASHLENWLGLHSGLLAQKYSKKPEVDKAIEERLNTILSLQWDEDTNVPKFMYEMRKVANTAQMISVLVDAYEATKNIYYLERARGLATILMTFQYENGDYADYSAIFYPVKSMMELIIAEKKFLNDPTWKMYYEKHWLSVKRAIDYLVKKKDNIMTEGQQTFEDGMISCSATQISMFAMMQEDPALKKHYTEAAAMMAEKHRPLEQSIIPDSRMNGGSIRFWEAQYDVLENKKRNMINSPHGWSAWRIYGIWYLYQLTGDEKYLTDVMNAIGACVQVIDSKSGKLRWAFVSDPYCEVELLRPNPKTPNKGEYYETVIGEQYVDMVSDFNKPESGDTIVWGYPRINGWSCNNDVHEIFKSMEEVCLTSAYVLERTDGSLITWNCKVVKKGGTLKVIPAENIVTGVHLNLSKEHKVKVNLASGEIVKTFSGMGWIGKKAFPSNFYMPKPERVRMLRPE
ncbi:hypothetical protein Q4Q34_10510 [Flavivirga abyssicola]|uniref:hypothetical protein n=1 Tax=Flavivirga abyssicola TaxID=3063533 RepID=UPI0026DF3CE2|nr:hypothetical protein [Flavivirga sp. MEBiC07777]WVK11657.1 hypothetical protein Q4Q34_10510 [Flavivirga sp. MEBiC07777]